jgi:hypothetical protein
MQLKAAPASGLAKVLYITKRMFSCLRLFKIVISEKVNLKQKNANFTDVKWPS